MPKNNSMLGLHWEYIGIMEKKMDYYLGFRDREYLAVISTSLIMETLA